MIQSRFKLEQYNANFDMKTSKNLDLLILIMQYLKEVVYFKYLFYSILFITNALL